MNDANNYSTSLTQVIAGDNKNLKNQQHRLKASKYIIYKLLGE